MKLNREFKVGDRVRIRQWDDMEKEFGLDCLGRIQCLYKFTEGMKRLCGREITIEVLNDKGIQRVDGFAISTDMLEPIEEGIPTTNMMDLLTANPERQYKRVSDGLIIEIKDSKYHWESGHEWIGPDDRWVEVPREKEVPFLEAIKALNDGKTIISDTNGFKHIYKLHSSGFWKEIIDEDGGAVSTPEILKGSWFIKES
jgi:hypothetical protein